MGFRNPVTSLSASAITDGSFAGAFSIPGLFTVGTPTGARVELGTNGAGKTGLRLYGADGTSVLIDLDTGTGTGVITGQMLRTAATGQRVEISPTADLIRLYSGDTNQTTPGSLSSYGVALPSGQLGQSGQTRLRAPGYVGSDVRPSDLILEQSTDGHSEAWLRSYAQGAGLSAVHILAEREGSLGTGPRTIELSGAEGVTANGRRVDYPPQFGSVVGLAANAVTGGPWGIVAVTAGPFPVAGILTAWWTWLADKQTATDDYDLYLHTGAWQQPPSAALVLGSTGGAAIRVSGLLSMPPVNLAANTSYPLNGTLLQRIGTGAITTYADVRVNRLSYLWVPTG